MQLVTTKPPCWWKKFLTKHVKKVKTDKFTEEQMDAVLNVA